jgi:hypothetical protein
MSAAMRAGSLLMAGLLAGGAWREGAPRTGIVHPVAPPLTHVPGAGEDAILRGSAPVGPPGDVALREGLLRTIQATGTPEQRSRAQTLMRATGAQAPSRARAHALRAAVAADTAGLVEQLGFARVEAMLGARERLSWRYAEGLAWSRLADAGRAP